MDIKTKRRLRKDCFFELVFYRVVYLYILTAVGALDVVHSVYDNLNKAILQDKNISASIKNCHTMKGFFRNILFNSFSIFILSQMLSGVKVSGGFPTYIMGGIALTLLFTLLRPVLNLLALPLNLLTLGMFSFLVNVIIFYLLTVFVMNISINSFTFQGVDYAGFIIPKIYFNTLFAFILTSFLQSLIVSFLTWLMEK